MRAQTSQQSRESRIIEQLLLFFFIHGVGQAFGLQLSSRRESIETRNKIGELQSILISLGLHERLGEYLSMWEPQDAAACGSHLMSLPECFTGRKLSIKRPSAPCHCRGKYMLYTPKIWSSARSFTIAFESWVKMWPLTIPGSDCLRSFAHETLWGQTKCRVYCI